MRLPNWNMTFTTKRRLQRIGLISLIVFMVLILVWFCWVIWIERYVVYSREGATIDTSLPERYAGGQVAAPPSVDETIPIYINEGSDTINTEVTLEKLTGYYIEEEQLSEDLGTVKDVIATLPAESTVLLELKSILGRFNYQSGLPNATMASSVDTQAVNELITEITSRNLYAVAMIPAFRDRAYVLNMNAYFLKDSNGYGWMDEQKCYWLDPTDSGAINWVIQIVEELRSMGFDEVVFTEFRIPASESIRFSGDRDAAIKAAAAKLVETCATPNFVISFATNDTSFTLPEGAQSRIYLTDVGAKDADAAASKVPVTDTETQLVFLATSTDTRYNKYGCLRPIITATMGN